FTFRIMWLDQSNQALPRHHPIHLDQEQLLAGLLALASVLGVRVCLRLPAYSASAKVICFIGKLGGWGRGILPNQKVFFRGAKPISSHGSR
ncbi:hypothetical protein, partial [Pseudomonas aeruginosa]|uniref:hypothetical protein n=1 Tax=Pseudomonas aeruginosa TaxID=287 RepID=UPI001A9F368D